MSEEELGSSRDHAPATCTALEGLIADARRYCYLKAHRSYHFGMSMAEPSPAEWGIEWQFQQSLPGEQFKTFDALIDDDIAALDPEDRAALQCKTDPDAVPGMNNILIPPDKDGQSLTVDLCEGCPPLGYPTDKMRCTPCPRRVQPLGGGDE